MTILTSHFDQKSLMKHAPMWCNSMKCTDRKWCAWIGRVLIVHVAAIRCPKSGMEIANDRLFVSITIIIERVIE
jgi:hypothetical protein